MTRYWISWYEPSPDPRPARDWQKAPPWWCTGYADRGDVECTTICAVVDAESEADAHEVIARYWSPVDWRFCEERPADWMPPTDRFPPKERQPQCPPPSATT